jgi:hypothetical protein
MASSGPAAQPIPTAPAGPYPAARAATRTRRWWIPVGVAVVVLLVALAAFYATGTYPFSKPSSGPPAYETFSQAESVASSGAGSQMGGSWFAVFGAGVASPTAVLEPTENLTQLTTLVNCTIDWPSGVPSNVAIPSTAPNAATGAAAFWAFGFKNASNALLVELVVDGVASALLKATGASCAAEVAYLAPFPTGVLDSPTIVATANGAGGSAFLATYPNASREWGAYGGIQLGVLGSTSPVWFVGYTTCSLPPVSGEVGQVFNATLGGTSGAVINSSTGPADCAPTIPTGLSLTAPAGASPAALRKAI